MLEFAIFAVCFVVFLLMLVVYLYPGSSKQTTIPGIDPSDPKEGNVGDIVQAGGLRNFLLSLHKDHGPITSFWMGTKLVISIGDAELFKTQAHIFDKPADLFELYRDLVGADSILFANGAEARQRRRRLDDVLTGDHINDFVGPLQKMCAEVVDRWESLPAEEHVPIYQYMYALCMKTCTRLLFGDYFFDDKHVLEFSRAFELCVKELEEMAGGMVPDPDSPRTKKYEEAARKLRSLLKQALENSSRSKKGSGPRTLADVLSDGSVSDKVALDDCVTFALKSYSLVSAMTWALYFLATHPDVQDTIAKEADKLMSEGAPLKLQDFMQLTNLQKTIKETLRTATVEPWTARCQDVDVEIAGHVIPKKTPVIQALGVVLHEEDHWKVPHRFDSSRFSEKFPELAYCPFGFAGTRTCPGKDLSLLHMSVFLVTLCHRLKLRLIQDQVVTPTFALITKTDDEVWLTLERRKP
uniref:Putative cytochrome p450 cyp4/cyp19/cyp26 subfamily n=1 Tax=Ixodes ricinus TaxID=34613 RepID=A0A0K8RBH4_IXORI